MLIFQHVTGNLTQLKDLCSRDKGQDVRFQKERGCFVWEALGSSASTCYTKDLDIFQMSLQENST